MEVGRHGLDLADRPALASDGLLVPSFRDRRAGDRVLHRLRRDPCQAPFDRRDHAASVARHLPSEGQIHRVVGLRAGVDLDRNLFRRVAIPAGHQQDPAPIPACLLKGLKPRKKVGGWLAAGLPAGRFPRRLICPR